MQAERQAAEEQADKAREQLKLLQTSLITASVDLKENEKERERLGDDLKSMTESFESKNAELDACKEKLDASKEELDASKVGIWSVSSILSIEMYNI